MYHSTILLATMLVAMNMFFSKARVGSWDNIHTDIHKPTLTPLTDQWRWCGETWRHGPRLTLETQLKWFLTNTRPLEETPLRILSIGWGSHYTNQNIPYGQSSAKLPVIMSSCLLSVFDKQMNNIRFYRSASQTINSNFKSMGLYK